MADQIELLKEGTPEPTLSRTRSSFSAVSDWRKYAQSYAEDLAGYEVVAIENNICSGARPSYVPSADAPASRMWFLPLELAREVNHRHKGMLQRLTVCYERVDNDANGTVLSSDGLRWPPNVTGAKVTFEDLADVDYSAFPRDEIVCNVAYNIIFSRQIKDKSERDAYLLFSLTNASLLVPYAFLEELQADPAAVDSMSGLQDHYERFVFLYLFVRISPRLQGSVASPQFYTTCLRYRRLLESWRARQLVDYEEAQCLVALFRLETAEEEPEGGMLYNRVAMMGYLEDCGFDDILESEQYQEIQEDLDKKLEQEEWSPLQSPVVEHRASGSVYIGDTEYREPVRCSSRNLSSRLVGIQSHLTGKTTCVTSFDGKPAVLRVSAGSMKLVRIDIQFVLKTMGWVAANNPVYQISDVHNPLYGGHDSNRLVLNAMNMGLLGESGAAWVLSQIVYGDVKVSTRSRNMLFRYLAQDEEGVRMDRLSRPAFTQQLAAVVCGGNTFLALASDVFLKLRRERGMWRVQKSYSRIGSVDGLGQFRTKTSVG